MMIEAGLQIYIILGILVGICLSKSKSFGIGRSKKTKEEKLVRVTQWERIQYGIYISGLWPIALINYWTHFCDRDAEEVNTSEPDGSGN
jgi:hypothetical protein